jgi:hypothetical protein
MHCIAAMFYLALKNVPKQLGILSESPDMQFENAGFYDGR